MSDIRDETAAFENDDELDAGLAAAFGPGASVMASLCESLPGIRPVQLRQTPEEGSGLVEKPHSREVPSPSATGRYQVFGEIARGGMGAILRGRDPDLGRDIAIKVLRDDHRANPKMIERFIEEAQIGGQLQHPGIAPVYELNQFTDRRPYFTMKLVKGRTLAALFHDRHDLQDKRSHLVSIFTQVAQTMAYAHSRGVIHRDLKPANIMIGSFGEVQLMDWGLAKVLPTGGIADEQRSMKENKTRSVFVSAVSEIKTLRSTGSGSETMAGSLLGTPAYMAPEQARGDTDLIDERCDVFGLGAILCELLTGKPPFVGESQAEVQRKASLGELTDAIKRLNQSDADDELIDLARRCIAAEPWDRPRDAKSVADAASGYQAAAEDRLRRAEKERAVAEMQAIEERKRRRVGMALVASVLLSLGMVGAGVWWWRDRQEKANREAEIAKAAAIQSVERGLVEAAQYRDAGRWTEAQIAAQKTGEFLTERVPSELKERVSEIQADLKLLIALDENRIQFSGERQEVFDFVGANAGYEAAFRDYGVEINSLDAAASQSRFPVQIRLQVAEALDHWAQTRMKYFDDDAGWKRLLALAQAVDLDNDWRHRLRDARLRKDLKTQLQLARSEERLTQSPTILVALARNLRESSEANSALDLLAEVRLRFPGDFWINYELGETCIKLNRHGEAVRYFNAALAARPQNTFVMTSVAWALAYLQLWKESDAICRRVIELRPGFHWAHGLLGYVLNSQGHHEESIVESRKAMELEPKSPNWPNNLGVSQMALKQMAEAEANFRKALAITPDFSFSLRNLEELLKEQNRKVDLTDFYREAVKRRPDSLDCRARLAEQSGDAADLDAALACFRRLLAKNPLNVHEIDPLVNALRKRNRTSEINTVWREALAKSPDSVHLAEKLAFATNQGADIDLAIGAFRKELAKSPKSDAWNWNRLSVLLRNKGQLEEAERVSREAIRLDACDKFTYHDLNGHLMAAARRADAIVAVREGLKRYSNDDDLWFYLGDHLYELGRNREALEPLQRSIQCEPNQQYAWNILGFVRFRLGDFVGGSEAMAQARDAAKRRQVGRADAGDVYEIRQREMAKKAELANELPAIIDGVIQPKSPEEAMWFGQICQYRGFLSHALRYYQQAFIAKPDLAKTFDLHQAACGAIKLSTTTKSPLKATEARTQALEWLRYDLERVDRQIAAKSGDSANWLRRWLQDESYSPVRDPNLLAKLPPEEKAGWEKFWQDIQTRLDKIVGRGTVSNAH